MARLRPPEHLDPPSHVYPPPSFTYLLGVLHGGVDQIRELRGQRPNLAPKPEKPRAGRVHFYQRPRVELDPGSQEYPSLTQIRRLCHDLLLADGS